MLDALSADDRRDDEEHLRSCDQCRADVAEFGGLPGLLRGSDGALVRTGAQLRAFDQPSWGGTGPG